MKFLVTGANGYVGQGIVKKLLNNGHEVVATDVDDEYIDKRAIIKLGNLFLIEDPFITFGKPDVLLHLAWRGIYNHNSQDIINDLPKHYNFIKTMVDSGLKHVCVLGTMHEVGYWEGKITDDTPRNPNNLYRICKNALRQSLEALQTKSDFILQWLVGFYTIGDGTANVKDGNVFLKISQAEARGDELFPFVTGSHKFDFVDYKDFIEMIYRTITQTEINGQIYCCFGNPTSIKERAEKYIKDNNYKIKLNIGAYPDRENESKIIYGDSSKISKILGENINK